MRTAVVQRRCGSFATPVWAIDVKFPYRREHPDSSSSAASRRASRGRLQGDTGTARATNGGLKIEVAIDMDSLYSDDPKLTGHLKSPDFFGVKANPTSKFVTTKIESAGGGFDVTGDLTLNGTVKTVSFPAKITLTENNITFNAEFRINRHEIGITFGKGQIDDDVAIRVAIDAKK